ncbi:MAG: DNA polymerase III subunit epsilon [Microbacteriaceae bacterium]|nr:DNA polymerase III subunit epsilon [Burkholderiaceae bacterium]
MTTDRRAGLAVVGSAAAVLLLLATFALAAGGMLWSDFDAAERSAVAVLLATRWGLPVMAGLALAAVAAAAMQAGVARWITAPARLLEDSQVLLNTDVQRRLSADGAAAPVRGLAQTINELARQRDQLKRDIADQVARASLGVAQERNRLAALMSELTQSVVVCNLDGRVLLYNRRARLQFRALSDAPAGADGAELIGLGRSIYTVFDRKLVAHALASVQQRLQRGVAHPSAQFVTVTRSGQLLRVQLAPVRAVDETRAAREAAAINGFVLMLDNITVEYEAEAAQERLLHGLTEGSRGSLANLQAAAEMLDDDGLPAALRARFVQVIRDEAQAMGRRLNDLATQNAQGLATRWPLEEMLGADSVQAARQRIEAAAGLHTGTLALDETLWLKLDSFALLQAIAYLALRLHDEFQITTVHMRLQATDGGRVHLDLVWTGQPLSTETVMRWELDPITATSASTTAGQASALTVRDVVQRHGGEFWFERDRVRQQAFFRFLLPQAPPASGQPPAQATLRPSDSRPEFYDFDLFAHTDTSPALDERRLAELSFTVFDTETTGLNPSQGDEILQIGATRLVNGKLLRGECFDQLVNPGRDIPLAGIPIHGITPAMVAGKPKIAEVLPAFHAFAQDTVLVAHNAAFDMRFLQLKEASTGLRFDQPVLDTLLLSALVHPNQVSHRLEAIAGRFDVAVTGRHSALGDAMLTAQVFQQLLPLLAAMGIDTLGQARAAAQKTFYARITY